MQKINKVLVVVGLVFGVSAGNAFADLIGYWSFEEGQGTDAADVTGNGNDGALTSGVEWVDGFKGGGVRFDTAGERIVIGPLDPTAGTNAMTLAAWINWEGQGNSIAHQGIIGKRQGWTTTGATIKWFWEATPANALLFRADFSGGGTGLWWNNTYLEPHANEWIHVALTWDDGVATQYINAEEVSTGNITFRESANSTPVTIGCVDSTNNETFVGTIDEARIYNEALDKDGLLQAMTGDTTPAVIVGPPNNGPDINRETTLSWMPGEFAATHDVYFGASFDDVSAAARTDPRGVQVGQGQEALSVDTGRLDFDQTYYWRVDEVNGAPDFAVFPGEVWSFTVEAFSIPITNVTTTASSSFGLSLAENAINGSGLVDDLHGSSAADMWISGGIPATIEFAFDRVYKLHELWIWNSNQLIESFVGFGAKDVVIEHSRDGENWTVLDGVGPLAQAPGTGGYAHNNTVDFGGIAAQQVRIIVNSVQGIAPQASLSEVRFYTIPTLATRPDPADGETGVAPDVALGWGRGGRDAGQHEVYVGADADSMTLAESVTGGSLESSSMDLELSQSYTWRVDEVNEAMDPMTWTGTTWSFTTTDTIGVDDMETYKDEEFFEIWATWIDGFDDSANNGALVGANPNVGVFAPESAIVNSGNNSLPIWFDNSAAPVSEATRTFDQAQDWTRSGVSTLVLYFSRGGDNTGNGRLYVKINDTKVMYPGDDSALPPAWDLWTQWNIDLTALGANLSAVRSLTIGIEGAGAQGVFYVDDIELYRNAPAASSEQVVAWFEAESGALTPPMKEFIGDPMASGAAHIGTDDLIGDQNANPPADGVATYSFDVPEDGVYRLAFRVLISGGNDSFWVRVSGMTTNTGNHASGWVQFNEIQPGDTWHWDEVHSNDDGNQVVDFTLSAGNHTLEIAQREDGTIVDAIAVIK